MNTDLLILLAIVVLVAPSICDIVRMAVED